MMCMCASCNGKVCISHVVWVRVRVDFYAGEAVFLQHVLDDPWCPEVGLVHVLLCPAVEGPLEVSVSSVEATVDAENGWFEVWRHSILYIWEDLEDTLEW